MKKVTKNIAVKLLKQIERVRNQETR